MLGSDYVFLKEIFEAIKQYSLSYNELIDYALREKNDTVWFELIISKEYSFVIAEYCKSRQRKDEYDTGVF